MLFFSNLLQVGKRDEDGPYLSASKAVLLTMAQGETSALARMRRGALVLLGSCIVGVLGYWVAGWPFLDSIYMVTLTIFGVGYQEVHPVTSPELKLFTIFLIISGCSALLYLLGGFFQLIAEGEFNRAVGKLRMNKAIHQINDHVIVCGYGRIGQVLCRELRNADIGVVVVDKDEARIAKATEDGFLDFHGDASHEATLLEAGIDRARALCSVLPNDASNVFITLTARNVAPKLSIIARGEEAETEPKLLQAGANKVVLPSTTSAQRMADIILRPLALDFLLDGAMTSLDDHLENLGLRMLTLSLDETADGKCVRDIEAHAGISLVVVSLLREGGEVEENPPLHTELLPRDRVTLILPREATHSFSLNFSVPSRRVDYRSVRPHG